MWTPQLAEVGISPTGVTVTPFRNIIPGFKWSSTKAVTTQEKGREVMELATRYAGSLNARRHEWHVSLYDYESGPGFWLPYQDHKCFYASNGKRLHQPRGGPIRDNFDGEYLGTWHMDESTMDFEIEIVVRRHFVLSRVAFVKKIFGQKKREIQTQFWRPVYSKRIRIDCR
jgi:hypothetical protein